MLNTRRKYQSRGYRQKNHKTREHTLAKYSEIQNIGNRLFIFQAV